jgi:hypothetical protein
VADQKSPSAPAASGAIPEAGVLIHLMGGYDLRVADLSFEQYTMHVSRFFTAQEWIINHGRIEEVAAARTRCLWWVVQ